MPIRNPSYFREGVDQQIAGGTPVGQADRFQNPEMAEPRYFSPQLDEVFRQPEQSEDDIQLKRKQVQSLQGDLSGAQQDIGQLLQSEDMRVRERARELSGFAEDIRKKLLKFNDIVNIKLPDTISPTQKPEEVYGALSQPTEEERVAFSSAIDSMTARTQDTLARAPAQLQQFPTLAETRNVMLAELSRLNELKNARAGLRKDILKVGKGRLSRGVLNAIVSVKSAEITNEINSVVGELDVHQRMYEQSINLIESQRNFELQQARFAREEEDRAYSRERDERRFALDERKFGLSERKQELAEEKFGAEEGGERKGLPEVLPPQFGVLAKSKLNQLNHEQLKRIERYLDIQFKDIFDGEGLGDVKRFFEATDVTSSRGIDALVEAYNGERDATKKQKIGTVLLTLLNLGK